MTPEQLEQLARIAQASDEAELWLRGTIDAHDRLIAAEDVDDLDGAMIAAHELLGSMDQLVGWAMEMEQLCADDEVFKAKLAEFDTVHPLRGDGRDLFEHRRVGVRANGDGQVTEHLDGAVIYHWRDDGSFSIEPLRRDVVPETIEVRATDAVANATHLQWEIVRAGRRAMHRIAAAPSAS